MSADAEYIFLIDRSGSMHYTIRMASTALLLFVQSLPFGCKFNICSYGSDHSFMFKNSVLYDDESLEYAAK